MMWRWKWLVGGLRHKKRCWLLGHKWSSVSTDPMYGDWCHCLRCGDLGCGMLGGPTENGW